MDENPLIEKQTLYAGSVYVPLKSGTRVKFHYQTLYTDNGKILDDSRKIGRPMELVLGKKFTLEVWEAMVQKMTLNEIAKFTVDKSLVSQYPFVAKTLRDIGKKAEERKHCCGMTLKNEGLGYEDLDELFACPRDLTFIIELISVEKPEDYEKESWQMTEDEKQSAIPALREKGNQYYKAQKYQEAEECYIRALGMLETLMLREKPHDTEWLELAELKIPLLLNYSQCRLYDKDYYVVLEKCNEVLDLDPKNVKALFRRGKAHAAVWNRSEARKDFQAAAELDAGIQTLVNKELKIIEEQQRQDDMQDKANLKKLFD